jgi:anti-sigma regulatory factor (Ser/Thr protein kinase)
LSSETRLEIRQQADVELARRRARASALEAGQNEQQAAEWSLVASELATNLVRHAKGGTLEFATVRDERAALVIESADDGPGIPDVAQAMTDGFSTGGTLGGGLPAVRRLSDDVQIESSPSGTSIVVRRWLP